MSDLAQFMRAKGFRGPAPGFRRPPALPATYDWGRCTGPGDSSGFMHFAATSYVRWEGILQRRDLQRRRHNRPNMKWRARRRHIGHTRTGRNR